MQHIVFVGGGVTSTVELPLYLYRRYGSKPGHTLRFIMAGLKNEHDDVWRMVDFVEEQTGIEVELVCWDPAQPGQWRRTTDRTSLPDIWDIFEYTNFMGSSLYDNCSLNGKRKILQKYLTATTPWGSRIYFGIEYGERKRMKSIQRNYAEMGYIAKAPLVQVRDERTKVERCLDLLGWVPELYELGFSHHNCGGFCVKGGLRHQKLLMATRPEVYQYHADKEQQFREERGVDVTILRARIDGKLAKVTLHELQQLHLPDETDQDFACNSCNSVV